MSNLVQRLKDAIQLVDSAVFHENPLPIKVVDLLIPGQPQFGLVRDMTGGRNLGYIICSQGMDEYFEESRRKSLHSMEVAKTHNFSAVLRPDDLCWQECMPYDEAETALVMAFHEVRHRVQFEMRVELFHEGHTSQVERCRLWGETQAKHYKNDPNGAIEFDAKFFECYGAFELRQGRLQITPEQLKSMLFMTPYWFLKKEKKKNKR